MSKYKRKKSSVKYRWFKVFPTIEAYQWFKNGDHPEDGHETLDGDPIEGKVVRYFRDPAYPGDCVCLDCTRKFHEHGWIDTLKGGYTVCPGDFIITGNDNNYYVCKPHIFNDLFEPIDDI